MDDVLFAGRNLEDLKHKLETFLEFCKEKNIKLKPSKFRVASSVEFGGCIVSRETLGESVFIEPKNKRILALEQLRKTTCKRDLQVFAGMVASLQSWFPSLPLVIPNIRRACGGTARLVWDPMMEQEYAMVKEVMKTQLRLSPYDDSKPLCLVVDGASSTGAGYVLFQWRDQGDPDA